MHNISIYYTGCYSIQMKNDLYFIPQMNRILSKYIKKFQYGYRKLYIVNLKFDHLPITKI